MTVTTISMVGETALLDIVRAATATVMDVPVGELRGDTQLATDLEADSLAVIEIVEVTEEQLRALSVHIRVDDGALARLTTLADLVAALFVAARGAAAPLVVAPLAGGKGTQG